MRTPTIIRRAADVADRTPADRNRYADFLRVASILVVVVGHWLMVAVWWDGSELRSVDLLASVPQAAWVTWFLQVMPIFFFVGGFANLRSWRSARRRRVPYGSWLRGRLRRLLLPVLPLLTVWALVAAALQRGGVDPKLAEAGSRAALVPVWFLAAYVVVVALTPLAVTAWERWGWWSVAVPASTGALVDLLALSGVAEPLAWTNYLFVWGTVSQLGFAWTEGRLRGRRRAMTATVVGLAATWVLVAAGPYPVAMVGLDSEVTNSNPPRVTLVTLAVFQIGLVLGAEAPLRRWLHRRGPWTATVLVSNSIMTLYLWHLTAAVGLVGLLAVGLDGFGLGAVPVSAPWWATRPLWFAAAAVATVPLLALFGRFERSGPDPRPAPRPWRPILGLAGTTVGLGLVARFGVVGEAGPTGLALAFAGMLTGGIPGARLHGLRPAARFGPRRWAPRRVRGPRRR